MMQPLSPLSGTVLFLISALAIVIYWQVFDLLQRLFGQQHDQNVTLLRQHLLRSQQLSGWLAALPLLGLLGTVGGLLESFSGIASGDQPALAAGIATALLTTQLGLTTALPALLLVAVCQRRGEHVLQEALCVDRQ